MTESGGPLGYRVRELLAQLPEETNLPTVLESKGISEGRIINRPVPAYTALMIAAGYLLEGKIKVTPDYVDGAVSLVELFFKNPNALRAFDGLVTRGWELYYGAPIRSQRDRIFKKRLDSEYGKIQSALGVTDGRGVSRRRTTQR